MDIGVKKEILAELYKEGKLDVAQLCDLPNPNKIYDIMVFIYYHEPDEYGYREMEMLNYLYGAYEYNDDYRKHNALPISTHYELDAILDNAERVFKALADRNIVSEHYRTYTLELKGDKNDGK